MSFNWFTSLATDSQAAQRVSANRLFILDVQSCCLVQAGTPKRASGTPVPAAIRRNTYRLKKCPEEFLSSADSIFADNAVRYGQKLVIGATEEPEFLSYDVVESNGGFSKHKSGTLASFDREQDKQSIWQLRPADPDLWIENEGAYLVAEHSSGLWDFSFAIQMFQFAVETMSLSCILCHIGLSVAFRMISI